jgi:nitrite reductase (cytochrome c-552)
MDRTPTTDPAPKTSSPRRGRWLVAAAAVAGLVTLGAAALLTNIFERKMEARDPFFRVVQLTDTTVDPAVWGRNFPLQYDLYRRTVDQTRTRYGGSEAMLREPTGDDPRDTVAQSRLEEDPRLREFWSGYAFAHDFREERGHAYMLDDQVFTQRQHVTQQPGTCLHCHASVYTAYRAAGGGDLIRGFEAVNQMKYQDAARLVRHPVSCIDCHSPATMALRVTRPGFIEGIRALKAAQGVAGYDVNRDASRQEMRTYVCGQCHVEYYFRGPEKRLTYPWARGLQVDSIMAYYDEVGHKDWTHAVSGAPVLKAQHPEFELFNQGVHARSGVACADCHMPYTRVGAQKVSDHWVRSPLLNVQKACQTCHNMPEDELRARVHVIQDRTYEMRNVAIDAVLQLTRAIAREARADSASPRVARARQYQRRAQFFTDFVEAENSMGFHADQEAVRILGRAVDYARLGQMVLRGEEVPPERPLNLPAASSVTPHPERRTGSRR